MTDRDEHFDDWLTDRQAEDPIDFETKTGEGWTLTHWRQLFEEELSEWA